MCNFNNFLKFGFSSYAYKIDIFSSFDVLFIKNDFREPDFEKYMNYGCWCFAAGDKKVLAGYGKPIDEIDQVS